MKKILLSLGIIAIVAVGAIGATRSFFSDTETSTGNTFTAGAIDLKVDSTQHYNGMVCELNGSTTNNSTDYWWRREGQTPPPAGTYPVEYSACDGRTWTVKDLVLGTDKFFNFTDIKPGDNGEDTISLHVLNNDAYVCAAVSNLTNADNSTTEPESTAVGNTTGGDLQNAMVWRVWRDDGTNTNLSDNTVGVAGDNIQNGDEPTLASGHPVNGTMALYDSTTGTGPLLATGTGYLGVSWSLPSTSGNETQTDSLTGDISFNVVQSRNNAGFKCSEYTPPVVQGTKVGANFSNYSAPTCTRTVQPGGSIQAAIDQVGDNSTVCVASGTHTSDNYPLLLNKNGLTLAGLGAAGSASLSGGVRVDNDGVTVEGLTIHSSNITGEITAVYLSAGVDNATVKFNDLVGPGNTTANSSGLINVTGFTTSGLTFNNNKSHDWYRGIFLNDSTSMTLSYNTLTNNGVGSANDHPHVNILTNNLIKGNTIEGVGITNSSGDTFTANTNSIYNNNNTNSNNDLHNYGTDSVNAQSNWWGDTNPIDNVNGLVDYSSPAASAFAEN